MKILVTGASGFLGCAVIKQLADRGYKIRALIHRKNQPELFGKLNIETVKGDVTRPESIDQAISGCGIVFHLASVYAFYPWWQKYPASLYKINVEGTKNLCEAALKQKVERFIYTSSIAAIGKEKSGGLADENTVFDQGFPWSHYARSKFLAEQEVKKACAAGLPGIILNPSILAGAGDHKPTPSGEIILKFLKKNYPFYFDCVLSLADVDDVALAHVAAITKGRVRERYILCNRKHYSLKEIFALLEKISGLTAPRLKIPYGALLVFSYVDEVFSAFFRKKPLIPVESLKTAHLGVTYDNSKATAELGFSATPLEETLNKSVSWYKENRYVKIP
ncbi:MAG: NAD-dependent epimerase/dehydratase family protein [Candidatus Omnitrophota bacterium]